MSDQNNPPNDGQGADAQGGTPPPPPPSGSQPPPPPPAPSGAQGGAAAGTGQPAELGPRILARIIDIVLLAIVNFVIIVPLIIGAIFSDVSGVGFGFGVGQFFASLVSAAITIGYFAWFEANRGQTIGKQVMNLRTVGPNGGNPTMEEAVKRNAWLALSIIPVLGGLAQLAVMIYIIVTISNAADKRGWHDQFAGGTMVVTA